MRLLLTPGQAHDAPQAPSLLKDIVTEQVIADKGYDSDAIVNLMQTQLTAEVVIPPKKNRTELRDYDQHSYQERHLVECFINKIKH